LSTADHREADQIQITFWGDKLFLSEDLQPVRQGTSVIKSIERQVAPYSAYRVEVGSFVVNLVLASSLVLTFIFCAFWLGDMVPFWTLVNTTQLLIHLPLMNLPQTPGILTLYMKSILNFWRLQPIYGINQWFVKMGPTTEMTDSVFRQMGYTYLEALPNLGIILFICIVFAGLICIALLKDWLFGMCSTPDEDEDEDDGVVMSFFKRPWLPTSLNMMMRVLLQSYYELCLCTLISIPTINFYDISDSS